MTFQLLHVTNQNTYFTSEEVSLMNLDSLQHDYIYGDHLRLYHTITHTNIHAITLVLI